MRTSGDDKTSTPEQDEQAPRVARLWVSNSGRVACDAHGGQYLSAVVEHFPRSRRHVTSLDAWEGYSAWEVALFLDGDFDVLACEDRRCGARIARDRLTVRWIEAQGYALSDVERRACGEDPLLVEAETPKAGHDVEDENEPGTD